MLINANNVRGGSRARSGAPSPSVVERALRRRYGQPRHFNKRDPLSELVFIVLSTQTREPEYRRTFAALRKRFRTWDDLRRAPANEIAAVIRFGGFAQRKAKLLRAMLSEIHGRRGRTTLAFLRRLPTADALAFLDSLPGVGPKTARCVAMYALGSAVLPVDTHVWRVAQRLRWVGRGQHPDERGSAALEAMIPPPLRFSLHVTMVAHGRAVCRAVPRCGDCDLAVLCASAR